MVANRLLLCSSWLLNSCPTSAAQIGVARLCTARLASSRMNANCIFAVVDPIVFIVHTIFLRSVDESLFLAAFSGCVGGSSSA